MSGGVDSSVAAWRLNSQREAIAGLFMRNWTDDGNGQCHAEEDRRDAVAVCGILGIAFHFRDFSHEYWQEVFTHFLAEYANGRTPNPDVLCNREIKFKHFLETARELGADRIATGHYARIEHYRQRWHLLRGADRSKDQSYFLHQLGQEQLAATLFPIGDLEKQQLRQLAHQTGLPTHAKKTQLGSASSENATSVSSSSNTCQHNREKSAIHKNNGLPSTPACSISLSVNVRA